MTFTIKSEKVGRYLIEIMQEKFESSYHVAMYEEQSEDLYGYPITDRYYPTIEKAKTRFNALKRDARQRGE